MIKKVLVNDSGKVVVIEEFEAKRGIGKNANEVIIYQFDKNKNTETFNKIIRQIKEEN